MSKFIVLSDIGNGDSRWIAEEYCSDGYEQTTVQNTIQSCQVTQAVSVEI
jgi:hypothetical protein